MLLLEFFEARTGWQDVRDDNSKSKWGESRKTKLTLGMINKVRRMSEVRSFERANDLKKIRTQYGTPPASPGGL